MNIGIDARMFGTGFGLARYVKQLTKYLTDIDQENQYILFVKDIDDPELDVVKKKNVKFVLADFPWYSWPEQIRFKKIIKKEKVDLMHFPHWNVPLLYNDPFVVTIHDLIMYHFPRPEATTLGPLKFWLKDRLHRIVVNHAVKKAKKIITTSEFTKYDLHKTLGVPMEKMMVTYQAPFNLNNLEKKQEGEIKTVSRPYVLYVGSAYPHKNLENLIKAWQIFEEKFGKEYQLILVGKEDYFYKKLKENYIPESVVFAGLVTDEELREFYKNAKLYIFPSKYEGFGLPPLEAQACGVPVVSSSASCLPEVLGESALYFDPDNCEQMAEMINLGLTDSNIRFTLQENAKENLQRFSWERLAKNTLSIYNLLGIKRH